MKIKKIFVTGSPHFIDKNIATETPKNEDADIETYFGDEMNKNEFFTFTNTVSLFGNEKYAIIRNASKVSDIESFISNLATVSEATIIASSELSSNKSDDKIIKKFKNAGFEIREESSAGKATSFDVIKIFKEKGLSISSINASYVLNVSGGDMTAVETECEKLSLYLATNKNLTADDAIGYIAGEKEEKIYMVVSSFAKKNTKECLELYKLVPNTYENNLILFFSMTKFVNNLYFSYVDPSMAEMKTQFQRNLMENKRYWTREEAAQTISYMASLDADLKIGKKTFENVINDIIIYTSIPKN